MMSHKLLITSMLLVVSYCCAHYVGNELKNKNIVLNEVLQDIIQNEVKMNYVLTNAINLESKRTKELFILSKHLRKEVDLILSLSDKPSYKHTGYVRNLFDKYSIDSNILRIDLSQPIPKYRLYDAMNNYLENRLENFGTKSGDLIHLKLRVNNKNDIFQVNKLNKLDLRFYEEHLYGNAKKYFYETNGEKIRIEKIPLSLDYIPEDIVFSVRLEDLVTGETRTINSKLRP